MKRLLALVLAGILTVGLLGCGGKENDAKPTSAPQNNGGEKTAMEKLMYWAVKTKLMKRV